MRIVILTQYFLPEMGAPQSRLYELAKGLQQHGWEVSVVTAMPNYPTGKIFPQYRHSFSSIEDISGIQTKRYWLYASNAPRAFPRIVSMLSFSFTALFSLFFIRSKKPDYLLVESPPLTLAFSGWMLSKCSGSRMIMNVSDLWPLSAKELGAVKEGTLYSLLEKLEHFLYRQTFLCTGQSQEIVDHISKIKSENVYLFRNGVDTSRFSNGAFDPLKRKYLVYAGLLGVAQGILSICENINFKALGTEFHIYGSGAEQLQIEEYIRLNPDKGIRYLGVMPRESVPTLLSSYGGALIALVKNIYGAVPSKIYEAMAAGLPILFSGEGEGAAIVEKHHAGWVSRPGQWSELSEAIQKFSTLNQESYESIRAGNKETAQHHFNRNTEIAHLHHHLSLKQ